MYYKVCIGQYPQIPWWLSQNQEIFQELKDNQKLSPKRGEMGSHHAESLDSLLIELAMFNSWGPSAQARDTALLGDEEHANSNLRKSDYRE